MIKRNLLALEWKLSRRGWFTGLIVIIGFLAMFAGVADMYTGNEELTRLIESYPPALLSAVGIDPAALTSFEGWMSTQPYTFYTLLLGLFGAIWAAGSIAKERDRDTAEWLFSLPYSRTTVFASKALAHWLMVTALYLLGLAVTLGLGYATTDVTKPAAVLLLLTAGYLIALAFSGVGFAFTSWLRSERAAISAGAGIVVVSFLLNLLQGLDERISWLADLSLFQAFDASALWKDVVLTPGGVVATLGIYFAGLGIGWALLRRQDI